MLYLYITLCFIHRVNSILLKIFIFFIPGLKHYHKTPKNNNKCFLAKEFQSHFDFFFAWVKSVSMSPILVLAD